MATDWDGCISKAAAGVTLRVKVVPGAQRDRVAGMLGDRLKLQVSAPPEAGKANRAVCALLAKVFDVPRRAVTVTAGQTQPRKTIHIEGRSQAAVTKYLDRESG